jgi:hypothetical protein
MAMKQIPIRMPEEMHRRILYAILDRNAGSFQEVALALLDGWLNNQEVTQNTHESRLFSGNSISDSVNVSGGEFSREQTIGDVAVGHWLEITKDVLTFAKTEAINVTKHHLQFMYDEHVPTEKRNRREKHTQPAVQNQRHARTERRKTA